ncbi:MAG TPA: ABC transporter substrate-binding protein [Arachnia sp.]|nr:ABC transporter substrate-binding protein [Arachnia sp.]
MTTLGTRLSKWAVVAIAAALPLTACGGSQGADPDPTTSGSTAASGSASADTGSSATGTDPDTFSVQTANENPALREQLDALAADQCKAENDALPLEHLTVAQADTVQKVTLLASQDALPAHTIAGTAMVRPSGDLGAGGLIVDLKESMGASGALDNVLPAVVSTEDNVYGGLVSMPYQYNIEGIWFNKQIFADNGIEEPQTWDELMAAAETLKAAGVTPMTQAGAAGWPLTRLMGMYIVRNAGPDAMVKVRDDQAKLTDPEYVAGAQALADFAAAGHLGEGFSTRDMDQSQNLFLTGEAAMTYDGSWFLGAINDPERTTIGAENVGFMPFPAVDGGAGSIDQYPANAGAPMAFSSKAYGPKVDAWVTCIAENYGQQAMQSAGIISGFKVNGEVTDVSPNTLEIQERIEGIDETVLWFEALFDPKSNSLASTNVTLLANGQMSAEDYMAALQESVDANR